MKIFLENCEGIFFLSKRKSQNRTTFSHSRVCLDSGRAWHPYAYVNPLAHYLGLRERRFNLYVTLDIRPANVFHSILHVQTNWDSFLCSPCYCFQSNFYSQSLILKTSSVAAAFCSVSRTLGNIKIIFTVQHYKLDLFSPT